MVPVSSGPGISIRFVLVSALFISILVSANIVAVKLISAFGEVLPAAIIVFPLSYLLGDILTEVYGFKRARTVIWLGFLCNVIVVAVIWIAGTLPSASFWAENNEAYQTILGYAPRLLIASFVAYLAGELANSVILSRMKIATKGRFLWARTIGSTIVGQGLDSVLFISVAFAGEVPELWRLIWVQWLVKVSYEVLATPITYCAVGYLKRAEGTDHFDHGVRFGPF